MWKFDQDNEENGEVSFRRLTRLCLFHQNVMNEALAVETESWSATRLHFLIGTGKSRISLLRPGP